MITVVAMSKERYELAGMMPEMACMRVLNPKDFRVNDFVVALETESGDEVVAKIAGIVEAHVHRGSYTHMMLFETRSCGGALIGNSHTIDLEKVPQLELQ
jgi:hypothetical protein